VTAKYTQARRRAPDMAIRRTHTIQRSAAASSSKDSKDEAKSDWTKYDDLWWPKSYRLAGPYAALDLWKTWGGESRFGHFSGTQRSSLIEANKARNGETLKSDAGNDPYTNLNETPGQEDSAEVDHVLTRQAGGSNHWWNARLISRKLNNSME